MLVRDVALCIDALGNTIIEADDGLNVELSLLSRFGLLLLLRRFFRMTKNAALANKQKNKAPAQTAMEAIRSEVHSSDTDIAAVEAFTNVVFIAMFVN